MQFYCCSGIEIEPKIVGGNPVDISKFPYQVLIQVFTSSTEFVYCGGSIISPNWVLTASHCIYKKPQNNIHVTAGRTQFRSGGVTRRAIQVIQHEKYGPSGNILNNDIALLRLDQPFKYSDTIRPIRLVNAPVRDGTQAWSTGWGAYSAQSNTPALTLQGVLSKIISLQECQRIYSSLRLSKNNVCADSGNAGTCAGDSGGPLAVNDNLIGVLSAGPRPCGNGNPDIYTSVAAYRSWIRQILLVALNIQLNESIPLDSRIIGGTDANIDQFPYQIAFRYSQGNSQFCGGSIISNNWILTAAHCLYNKNINQIYIVAGTAGISDKGVSYKAAQFIIHKDYSKAEHTNDIGVVKVTVPIKYTDSIRAIKLADNPVSAGTRAWLTGWGYIAYPQKTDPKLLQKLVVTTISLDQCKRTLRGTHIDQTNVCTISPKGEGACSGDSGGPLVSSDGQIGVVSFGIPCGLGYPDVFASVPSYRDWIRENTGI
ncbi:uncharacterized protein LOC128955740 [Oppia nitens]|uniref:uncharacterized protein LOC128955740 n=1 Tax=Oppia nitens TaxID=1686743 RepID=UPI0023DC7FED|nr:uncharacterized protein LOC128955740 [Oppia nitens]